MLRETIAQAMNRQINAELYSAYLYLSMSDWCEHEGFPGFANWLRVQARKRFPPRRRLSAICWIFLSRPCGMRSR